MLPGCLSGVYVQPPTPALTSDCVGNGTHKRRRNRTSFSCALHHSLYCKDSKCPWGSQQLGHIPLLQGRVTIPSPGVPKPLSAVQYKLILRSLCSTCLTHHLSAPKPLPKSSEPVSFPRGAFSPVSLPLQTSRWPLLGQAERAPWGKVEDPLALASRKSCPTRNMSLWVYENESQAALTVPIWGGRGCHVWSELCATHLSM